MSNEINSISGITDLDEIKRDAEREVESRLSGFEHSVFAEENLRQIIKLAKKDWDDDEAWREMRRRHRPRGG